MERRRRERLALRHPVAGEISVMQDVIIESVGETELTVIAAMPVAGGEAMLLHAEDMDGGGSPLVVQGFERRPVVVDGQFRHRLRLSVVRAAKGESA